MGLTHIAKELEAEAAKELNLNCSVTRAYAKFLEVDPEAAADLAGYLAPTSGWSGPDIATIVNRRFAELEVKGFDVKVGPVNNHRRKGCTCGSL